MVLNLGFFPEFTSALEKFYLPGIHLQIRMHNNKSDAGGPENQGVDFSGLTLYSYLM